MFSDMNPAQKALEGRRIGILGGGITGLTAAFYLLRAGATVVVIEARPEIGGLASYFDFGSFAWDRFYHCILRSDLPLLSLIEDLDLSAEMRWTETKVGFFTNGALHPMSSTGDFVRFPALSPYEKLRLGLGILYASLVRDGARLESIPVSNWLIRVFGRGNYNKMWAPLLKAKLGACHREASAAFIWATIRRLYSTRDRTPGQKECLGYVRGGYRTAISRMIERIGDMGGEIVKAVPIRRIYSRSDGRIDFVASDRTMTFDDAIATIPSPSLTSIVPELSSPYVERLKKVKYLGVVCMALVLKRKLSPFYVTNLTDQDLPFTGIIEMTNLISLEETCGRHLVYLPKYTAPDDPLFDASDDEVWSLFYPKLKGVIPELRDSDVERRFVFRERFVQPLPVVHYSRLVPPMETNLEGLFLANTTQIVNSTLNNNEMVKIARRAVSLIVARADKGHTPTADKLESIGIAE